MTAPPRTSGAGPSGTPTAGQPTATGSNPASTPSPFPADGEWGALDLPPLAPVASFEATRRGGSVVAADTDFTLTSLDGTPVAQLAKQVTVEPAIVLTASGESGDRITLRPSGRLEAGQRYRFTLTRADGSIAGRWQVTAATALHLVGSIPGDQTNDVPTNTAIEMTFDQRGVTAADVERSFSISPSVEGRFEVHGRAVAFIPDDPLRKLTIYTVTLRKGLPLEGTGQALPADVTFRFETKGTTARSDSMRIDSTLVDFAVDQAPIIEAEFSDGNEDMNVAVPNAVPVTVHRLPDVAALTDAWKRLRDDPGWAASSGAPLKTDGLTRVLAADVPVQRLSGDESWMRALLRLPDPLPRGWYVLTATFEGRPEQTLIQIANIAAYSQITETKSVVWVNSVGTGAPIAGATVEIAGALLGTTDADGLRVAATPAAARDALEAGATFLVVRAEGRTLVVPIGGNECGKCYEDSTADEAETPADLSAWWSVLTVDRQVFRPTDQVDVWGVLKDRAKGRVPSRVEVILRPNDGWGVEGLPIARMTAAPKPTGMFSTQLSITDAPIGDYSVELRADGQSFASQYVRIEPIIKPAFTLSVSTNKRAVLTGQSVRTTVRAAFFEGTPVGGVALRVGLPQWYGEEGEESAPAGVKATTDVDGRASAKVRMRMNNDNAESQWEWQYVGVRPTLPEEAEIEGSIHVAVFRSTGLLDAGAVMSGSTLRVTGAVHAVDFAKMNKLSDIDWDVDPRGAPIKGARVRLAIVEEIHSRHRTGTAYDPITKTTHPTYESTTRTVDLGTKTVRTRADGTFRFSMTVNAKHSYRIVATWADPNGRRVQADTWAGADADPEDEEPWIEVQSDPADAERSDQFSVGETIRAEMVGGHPRPATDRYLFLVSSRGLRIAQVQDGPRFTTTFRAPWIPSAEIGAVRFTGTAYEVVPYPFTASFDERDEAVQVRLTTDKTRYAPGDSVRLSVRTTDTTGRPVATTVALRAVDEKLYAMGFASDSDLLATLYTDGESGVIGAGWSHGGARFEDGSGDTGGGDDGGDGTRSDFRDAVLFRVVTTDGNGRGSVAFTLADDLTSWHVAASALDRGLHAGDATMRIPVGLPFFAEATLAQEYLVGDRPFLRVRGYGSALASDAEVLYTVSSTSLGLPAQRATARAFTAAAIRLPKLPVGTHEVRIVAETGSGSTLRKDVLVRRFTVVANRAVGATMASGPLVAGFDLQGGATGFTRLVLADGGRGRVVPVLLSMLCAESGRADSALAASMARTVLLDGFGMAEDELPPADPGLASFQDGGIALLPYGSADLELSTLAALADDPAIDAGSLAGYFEEVLDQEEPAATRERQIVVLAGRAALGEPVLDAIHEAAQAPKLTRLERAWLALGALAGGDEPLATTLERGLLEEAGERLGPWVRVGATDREETASLTALVAITAAGIGDPLAADLDAYLASVPPEDTLLDLQRALAARFWAERTPAGDAVAELTVDGTSRRLDIRAGELQRLTLTPAQLRTARLEPVSGSVVVTTTWEAPVADMALEDKGITAFTRTVKPAGTIGLTDVVVVEYTVRYGKDGDLGSWLVSDVVPSGLAPLSSVSVDRYDESGRPEIIGPWRVVGQRVDFVVTQWQKGPTSTMRYIARVVSPGTFGWEPVVAQSSVVPTWGRMIDATTVKVASK